MTFLKNRLEIAKELLSDDGNIFIHIDVNQDHYLKIILDSIFGEENFVQEIIWSYGSASGGRAASTKPVNIHDYILHYSKNYSSRKANKIYTPYSEKYINDWFKYTELDGRRYRRRHRGKDENGDSIWQKQYLDESQGVPLTTVWSNIKQVYANPQAYKASNKNTSEIELAFGNSGQKPEALIKRIIEMSSDSNDIVLDFFMGSGTTQNTALKLRRRFIGIEQLNSQINISVNRLQETISGKYSGISKDIDWKGRGSFVYVELDELNQQYSTKIQESSNAEQLQIILDDIINQGYINYEVDLNKLMPYNSDFRSLEFEEQKQILIDVLDKNLLYLNYSEMDDSEYNISEEVKEFNRSFYEGIDNYG